MNKLKIAIAAAMIGVVLIFLLSRYSEKGVTRISDLSEGQIGMIKGMINSVYITNEGHAFIKVTDSSGEITVVAFNNSGIEGIDELVLGDQVSVFGKVDNYKGKLEVIAREIRKL